MKIAMIFPGQGSQYLQMLSDFHDEPIVQNTFREASDALAYDVWQLAQLGPESQLNNTSYTQPVLLTAGVALFNLWQHRNGIQPAVLAGHSLGEYSALVAAGSMQFQDACKLTSIRGTLMQKAVPVGVGLMAAIIGLENNVVESICKIAAENEIVAPANYNAIGQIVISGHKNAVMRACELANEHGAKLTTPLAVSVPSHSGLMREIADEFAEALQQIQIQSPKIPVIHNVDVATANDPIVIREKCVAQLYSPVRWVETVLKLKQDNVTTLIECGPGRVLTGLTKRIDRSLESLSIQDSSGFEAALVGRTA